MLTPKKPVTGEGSTLLQELSLPTGVREEHLLPHRFDIYSLDYDSVHWVRASLLGLAAGTILTAANLNASPRFTLRSAALERELPEIVTSH